MIGLKLHRRRRFTAIGLALVALVAAPFSSLPSASAQLVADCTAAKLKQEGKAAAKVLKCYAKSAKNGAPVDTTCLTKIQMKLGAAFAKADVDAPCWGGQGFEWSLVTEAADALKDLLYPQTLTTGAQYECASAKLKLAAKLAAKKANCRAKAVKKGEAVDPACLQKVEATFDKGFQKVEAAGGCGTNGDAGSTKAFADQFVDGAVDLLTADQVPFRCCNATAAVPLGGQTVNVTGCADLLIGTCPQATTLLQPVGGAATQGAPGTVCDGAVGSCQPARTGTSMCCEATKGALQICAEGPSLGAQPLGFGPTTCSLANGNQGGVTFTEHPGALCVDHYPDGPPSCQ